MIEKNYFEIFDLPILFKINEEELTQKYFDKQLKNRSDDYDLAYLNMAYKTLNNPINRAEYILELQGRFVNEGNSKFTSEMFEIHDKYEQLSKQEEREIFFASLKERIANILSSLHKLDENSEDFFSNVCLCCFINSFLKKVDSDVYNRD